MLQPSAAYRAFGGVDGYGRRPVQLWNVGPKQIRQHSTAARPARRATDSGCSAAQRPDATGTASSLARAGVTSGELAGLEAMVRAINGVLALQQRLTGGGGRQSQAQQDPASGAGEPGAPALAHPRGRSKLVRMGANARAHRDVPELSLSAQSSDTVGLSGGGTRGVVPGASARTLRAYLSLPPDQYSVLDPRWISRLEESTTDEASNAPANSSVGVSALGPSDPQGAFVLRVPLSELVGLDLTPQLVVRVAVDTHKGRVSFSTDGLTTGDPRVDADVDLQLSASLGSSVKAPPRRRHTDAANAAFGNVPAHVQQVSELQASVEVSFMLRVPPPISLVPGPLLSSTGSLLTKLVLKSLMPSFLELLEKDYARWAAGSTTEKRKAQPVGSLLAPSASLERVQLGVVGAAAAGSAVAVVSGSPMQA